MFSSSGGAPPGVDIGGGSSGAINAQQGSSNGLPTVEQLNRALAESGERDRLKAMLKTRLWEAGWHEQLKAECLEELKRRGVDRVGPHELATILGARAKGINPSAWFGLIPLLFLAAIPESVKGQVMQEIGTFLDKVIVIQQQQQFNG